MPPKTTKNKTQKVKDGKGPGKTRSKKSVKTYKIHDNGGTPFVVEDNGKAVTVFKTVYAEGVFDKYTIGDKLLTQPYKHLFVGDNDSRLPDAEKKGWGKGNSLLVVINPTKMLYIGSHIYTFEPVKGDTIQAYYSPVGNSDVPYPWAVGTTHTYFMLGAVSVPNDVIEPRIKDPYSVYYGHDESHPSIKKYSKKLHTTKIA